ncbi:hypothetical protein D3C72_1585170 [compost metagenome]
MRGNRISESPLSVTTRVYFSFDWKYSTSLTITSRTELPLEALIHLRYTGALSCSKSCSHTAGGGLAAVRDFKRRIVCSRREVVTGLTR